MNANIVPVEMAIGPIRHVIDSRWAMNYAAAVQDENPRLYDPRGPVHVGYIAHLEWLVRQQIRMQPALQGASGIVQLDAAAHLHRALGWDERVTVSGGVRAMTQRSAGAIVVTQFEVRAQDGEGEVLARTSATSLYRGIEVPEVGEVSRPERTPWSPAATLPMKFGLNASHVYSECARIWVPFHTDIRSSLDSGYDRLILHGTASLSYCVSSLVNRLADGDHTRVIGYGCSFANPVFVDSHAELGFAVDTRDDRILVRFVLNDASCEPLLEEGELWLQVESADNTGIGGASNAPVESLDIAPW